MVEPAPRPDFTPGARSPAASGGPAGPAVPGRQGWTPAVGPEPLVRPFWRGHGEAIAWLVATAIVFLVMIGAFASRYRDRPLSQEPATPGTRPLPDEPPPADRGSRP